MTDDATSTAKSRQHSTRSVIAAALMGIAVGAVGLSVLSPSPAGEAVATAPLEAQAGQAPSEQPAVSADVVDGSDAPGAGAVDGSDAADAAAVDGVDGSDAAGAAGSVVVDQAAAEQAAIAHLGEGRVTWVSRDDDYGAAWEIEVTLPSGREVDVYVDANRRVVRTS